MGAVLQVRSRQPSRRRSGFTFTPEPTLLSKAEIGEGVEAAMRFLAIVQDPLLQCVLIGEDGEQVVLTEEQIAEIGQAIEVTATALAAEVTSDANVRLVEAVMAADYSQIAISAAPETAALEPVAPAQPVEPATATAPETAALEPVEPAQPVEPATAAAPETASNAPAEAAPQDTQAEVSAARPARKPSGSKGGAKG